MKRPSRNRQLVKKIDVTIYFPYDSFSLFTQTFTVENDIPMNSLNDDLKRLFKKVSPNEVFFSATFSFFEKGTTVDLWDKLVSGLASMQEFMDVMYEEIGEDCPLCNHLRDKIRMSKFSSVPKDFWLVNDYAYYLQKDEFERAGRLAMYASFDGHKVTSRGPLKNLTEANYFNYDGTPFGTFVLMHALIRTIQPEADIMPAILTVYNDDTYDLDVFHANIKTTMYRKIADVAERIIAEDIRQVCLMALYSYIPNVNDALLTSKERVAISPKAMLVFMSVDQALNEMEYVFDGELLSKIEYVTCVMAHGHKDKLDFGRLNMIPIIQAFKFKGW